MRNRRDAGGDSLLDVDEGGGDSGDARPKQQQQQQARRGKVVQSESEADDSHDEGGGGGEEADVEMVDGSSSGDDSDFMEEDQDVGPRWGLQQSAAPVLRPCLHTASALSDLQIWVRQFSCTSLFPAYLGRL